MFDVLKQAVFTSIGLASLTRDKVQEIATEVARRGKLTEQESNEFQAELTERADKARQELQAEIDRRIDHAFIQVGILKAGVKKEGEAVGEEIRAGIDKLVNEGLERLGLVRADDFQALKMRLEALEKKAAAK